MQDCEACPAVTLSFGGAAVCLRAIQVSVSCSVPLKCIAQPVQPGLTARTVLDTTVRSASASDKQLLQIAADDDILYESLTVFAGARVTLSFLEVYGEVYLPRG